MYSPGRRLAVHLTVTAVIAAGLTGVSWLVPETSAPAAADPVGETDLLTEAQAQDQAVESGEAVEVTALRTERREVTANPDGSFTATEFTAPVRTVVDGDWIDVDPTLQVHADGTIAPVATTIDMRFSSGGDQPLVTVNKNNRSVALSWDGPLPTPTIAGPTATYSEVLPDVDLEVTALIDGFTHVLIVKNAQAANNPALAEIDMPIAVDGARVRASDSGGVEWVDSASGSPLVMADQPIMWDSRQFTSDESNLRVAEEGAGRAPVSVTVDTDSVTLEPDQALLTAPDTVYPVYIDPVYRDEYRSAWAMVDRGYPSQSYYKFAGADDEGLGRCNFSDCNSSMIKRLLYKVSTSFYKGRTILSATFGATLAHNYYGSDRADRADLYLSTTGITSGTTWNSKVDQWNNKIAEADTPAPSGGSCTYSTPHATEWNVKTEVQAAANSGKTSLTFGMRNASETDATKWMRFCHNGHLRVTYNTPPEQADTNDMGITPGKACTYAIGADSYTNKPPTIFATLKDDDHGDKNEWGSGGKVSEQLRAEFRLIWDDQEWTAPLSGAKASGSQFQLDLATAAGLPELPHNTPIGWIVRAHDANTAGPWSWAGDSSRCRFVIDPTTPDPPVVTSIDFPDGDAITEGVGEIGSFDITAPRATTKSYIYDFNDDDAGPKTVELDNLGDGLSIDFMPVVPGRQLLTVTAVDANGLSSSTSYSFRVSVPAAAGRWGMTDSAGSLQAVDVDGTNPAMVGDGVDFAAEGPGVHTAAHFDGTPQAYASTGNRSIAPTGESFAAAAWVKIDDLSKDATAVSVDGTGEAGFRLGYHSTSATTGTWTFEIPDTDVSSFTTWRIIAGIVTETNKNTWVHLIGSYNAFDNTMRLYLNGQLLATAQRDSLWNGTNTVQIGRSLENGRYRNNWTGSLADIAIFDRYIVPAEANHLGAVTPRRTGYWQLNAAADGLSPEYLGGPNLQLSDGASIYNPADPVLDPFPLMGAGHLELDGTGGCAIAAAPTVDTQTSFTLSARVRPVSDAPETDMVVLSIPGSNGSMVTVGYSAASESWQASFTHADATGAATTVVTSRITPTADGFGQAIAVVYNAYTGDIILYVDGVASEPLQDPYLDAWAATGVVNVGQAVINGSPTYHFSGAIDDVRTYSGVANHVVIDALKKRDEDPSI
ncbi:concanavalin A-like lectin/glucanase superfamily protein [Stackebrandtia endophytica]|uniref:Concanavalin A-like lectin/glucanase superfamily protein n=1 Tax=Stackebrandtia endophytica TaxID=1496996 RepID=A0A543B1V3_9ACTN|nr:concanavalin A-like lectin/glucanase superfamily protein [Stackebrandtia endophytica]